MGHDISESIPQGSDRAQEAENCRKAEIAYELSRLYRVHETQSGDCQINVNFFDIEQRAAEQMAKAINCNLLPRNVLVDAEGAILLLTPK